MHIALIQNQPEITRSEHTNDINAFRWNKSMGTVSQAIESSGHTVRWMDPTENVEEAILQFKPDLVFLQSFRSDANQSIFLIQESLERLGVPYTGSPVNACWLARDKYQAKCHFREHNIPTPDFELIPRQINSIHKPNHLKYPLFIKPISTGCSQGIHVENPVHTDEAFHRVVWETLNWVDQSVLVETFIPGREFTVGILGNEPLIVLPILEFVGFRLPHSEAAFRSFDGKTNRRDERVVICPAELSERERDQIERLAVEAFQVLGCADYARIDFRCDLAGSPYLLEINVHPSLLPNSSFAKMTAVHGVSYPETIEAIIQAAIRRSEKFISSMKTSFA